MTNAQRRPAAGPEPEAAAFRRLNPVSGEVATTAPAATVADALAAADAARDAFPAWSSRGPNDRRACLLAAQRHLDDARESLVALMMRETGATRGWAHFNMDAALTMLGEAAAMTTQITGQVIPSDVPGNLALAVRRPAGVCLGIVPWNAPIVLAVRAVAMPLACGNTVVLKASEFCPGLHRLVVETMNRAPFGAGVLNVVTNAPEDAPAIVEVLIAHPAVKRINFTGSTRVGRIIAQAAARFLKPVLLELGGKAPMVVLDDADLDAAVDAAIFGAFLNQGQICMSTERIVLDQTIAEAFVERFAARARALTVGDPMTTDAVLGALVEPSAAERIDSLVRDARAQGAAIVAGGTRDGALMQATVIDHVTPAMRIYHEESFGPVTTVVRVAGIEEAVRVANDTEFGLSASVFGRDLARAMAVAERIESGICHVNGPTVHDEPQMPFGGVKASGHGRFGGTAGIAEFTELRWLSVQSGQRQYPF